jgi:hypothetical protein
MSDLSIRPTAPYTLWDLHPAQHAGLLLLREAYDQSAQLGYDHWQFAVELDELIRVGLTRTDVRVLVALGLVRHAAEKRHPAAGRTFRRLGTLRLPRRCCFVLTENGLRHVSASCPEGPTRGGTAARPFWDGALRQLCWHGEVVKRFRQPADNQERVLAAFQEDGWPSRIDDPLPPAAGSDAPGRLRATVKCLNRGLPAVEGPRFFADGTGQGVCWSADPRHLTRSDRAASLAPAPPGR